MHRAARPNVAVLGSTLLVLAGIVAACGQSSGAGATPTAAPAGSVAPTSAAGGSGTVYQVTIAQDPALGAFLTGEDGKTLYVLTKDSSGVSTCSGNCATAWPPLTLDTGETVQAGSGVTGTLATLTRADGSVQVTYNGAPLYYFSGDSKAGDTSGQGTNGVWFVVSPAGGPNMGPGASPEPSSSGGRYSY
jgi:predicted lipoprotein with Yx(FWY)xxD motif